MVIWPNFRMKQYSYDDHREDAPHFIYDLFMIYETMAIICWNRTEVCNTDSISGPSGNKKENIRSHISSGKPGVCCILR